MKKFTLPTVFVFGILLISGCSPAPNSNTNNRPIEKQDTKPKYQATAMIEIFRGLGTTDTNALLEKSVESLELLAMEVVPAETGDVKIERTRNALNIYIRVVTYDPDEAAKLANLITERYVDSDEYPSADIIDKATPPKIPIDL